MVKYYQFFAAKTLHPEPHLTDFYHQPECQKNGGLLFVTVAEP